MFLVVDANVIFSAILGIGHSSEVFAKNAEEDKFEFIAPEFILIEIGKHTSEMAERTHYSPEDVIFALEFIARQITFIPETEFSDKRKEAEMILKEHQKDVPYLALALKRNCKIFSGDRVFKQLCPDKVKTPKELLDEFYK